MIKLIFQYEPREYKRPHISIKNLLTISDAIKINYKAYLFYKNIAEIEDEASPYVIETFLVPGKYKDLAIEVRPVKPRISKAATILFCRDLSLMYKYMVNADKSLPRPEYPLYNLNASYLCDVRAMDIINIIAQIGS